ncbi:MAG: hypothetical protein P9M14_02450 [Candidatus Alcyoniella australis]|nr:hypothetical protein [Candidatus Alcyoniella australis]
MPRLLSNLTMNVLSLTNAVAVGALRSSGLLPEARLDFTERLESTEEYNTLLGQDGSKRQVACRLELRARADLRGFLDPTDLERFMGFSVEHGSSVQIPGLARQAAVHQGWIRFSPPNGLQYQLEFLGDHVDRSSGSRRAYYFRGAKRLRSLRQVRAWSTLSGGVYDKQTGRRELDSVLFSAPAGKGPEALLAFVKSLSLR